MNQMEQIKQWNVERGIDKQEFVLGAHIYMIMEEMFEMVGLPDDLCKTLGRKYATYIQEEALAYGYSATEEQILDSMMDRIVIDAGGAIKLGYDPTKSLAETIKEINSRTGSFDKVSGKWVKSKTKEAMAKWYKADYSQCKL
jgi:hypothetical protein